ncbi:MAG: hypothetical protein AABW71_02605 [Nanoarchaeota archaeon]
MYEIATANSKVEKKLQKYMALRNDITYKLDRLKENPRRANGAHQLHGDLKGKWACWLGSNIRTVYVIKEELKYIVIQAVGTHKIY